MADWNPGFTSAQFRLDGKRALITGGRGALAEAMAATLADLGWPEETNPTRLVVPAGSIGITHFDVYHRGERQILLLLPCRC